MARKQIVLTTDTFANMVSKINTMGTHVGDLDNLDAGVPLDSDVVQVLNALYDSIGDYSLALNTDAQTLKGAINELEDSVETLKADRDSDETNIMELNSDRDSAAASMNQLMLDRDSDETNIQQLNQDRDSAAAVMNQLMQDRDSDDGKARELDSNQTFLLHVIGTGINTVGAYNQATQTYSGDISTFDDSISDKSGIVPAINDLQGQITQIKAAAGLTEGNVGSLANLQDPIERSSVVASINSLRDSVQAMHDSTHIGGLTLDANRIGTNTGDITLHSGFGSTVGTTFGKFERYKDSDLKISAGDAGSTALIIADSSVTVEGNLRVRGTTTTVHSETITVDDNIIELNTNYAGADPTEDGGIDINRGTHAAGDARLVWDEGDSNWQIGVATDLKKVVRKGEANDVTTAMIQDDAVTNAKLRNSAGYSVIGKATNGAGNPADITLAANSFLGRSGTSDIAGTTLSDNSVLGKSGTSGAGAISIDANRVLGRDGTGNITGIQIDDSHISATAGIVNSKLANSSITVNSVTISLGGSGTIDIAGGIDSLGAVSGIITAGVGGNASPIPGYDALEDSSTTIIMGHHPELVNPTNDNLPARSVLIGWHAGSTSDQDNDNDGQLNNVAIGYLAGYNNDARHITAIGAEALGGGSLTSGDGHVAIGYQSLYDVSSSINNVAVGKFAGYYFTSGSHNVAVGYNAGPGVNGGTANTSTYLGMQAGHDGTTGTNNTLIGYNAQKSSATASNEFTFGDANVTKWRFPGVSLECTTKTFIYASDGTTVLRTFLTGTS